jgi:hypothetical protein
VCIESDQSQVRFIDDGFVESSLFSRKIERALSSLAQTQDIPSVFFFATLPEFSLNFPRPAVLVHDGGEQFISDQKLNLRTHSRAWDFRLRRRHMCARLNRFSAMEPQEGERRDEFGKGQTPPQQLHVPQSSSLALCIS